MQTGHMMKQQDILVRRVTFKNLLPPLRVLDAKREKELINNLEKLNFSIKSLMAA